MAERSDVERSERELGETEASDDGEGTMTADEQRPPEGDDDMQGEGGTIRSKIKGATMPIKEATAPIKDAAARGGEAITSTVKGAGDRRRRPSKKVVIPVAAAGAALAAVVAARNRPDVREKLLPTAESGSENAGGVSKIAEKGGRTARDAFGKASEGLTRLREFLGALGQREEDAGTGDASRDQPSAGDEGAASAGGTEPTSTKSERDREAARRERDARRRERRERQVA